MKLADRIRLMDDEALCEFILHQINSECHGNYDDDCKEEGCINCKDCVMKMLNRESKSQ